MFASGILKFPRRYNRKGLILVLYFFSLWSIKLLFSVFNQTANDAKLEPIFLGQSVNISRYDEQKYLIIERMIEKQISFFWRPEEVDISRDRMDFNNLPDHEKHIFLSNLKYQTLLDSIQGRSPNIALLPLVSLPEVETFIEAWAFFETIHSRSYTHIIRNLETDPSKIFNGIIGDEEILKRAKDIAVYYDELIEYAQWYNLLGAGKHNVNGEEIDINLYELKKRLFLCLISINALEGVRFYVSFACSFSFAERKQMEGNAKIIRLIARDETIHCNFTSTLISYYRNFSDDPEMSRIAYETEAEVKQIYQQVADQEKQWAKYLFKDGSMIGLNENILSDYVEYITDKRMKRIGYESIFPDAPTNPLPWMDNWLISDNVQVAPQEAEIANYLVGQIDADLEPNAFSDFEL